MADFHALEALINAYIKQNGVQAITGQILNGILRGMVSALGKGWTVAGQADPSTDPGTMTGPVAYIAHEAGTYTHFGGLVVDDGEVAFLKYDEQTWTKEVLASLAAVATVDNTHGTPSVQTSFVNGVLTFAFSGIKGDPGEDGTQAGFGTVSATVDDTSGTPAVSVTSSGPDTAKNFAFAFTNLKGETGVTSAVVTVDNTSGAPACAVSLVGQELHLDFTGLKGAQGNPGSSVDYPFTLVNNLTTNDATQALTAAMGYQLEGEITQLEQKVGGNLMSSRAKNALLAVFEKVAFAVPDVSAEMDELNRALFNLDEVTGVNAVYTQGNVVIWSDGVSSLNDLKANLVVKAEYGDGTEVEVHNYTLSGSLTTGTSVITVTYQGFTTTFNVTVTEYGSKMSYTMAEGSILNKPGRLSAYNYGGNENTQGVGNYELSTETTRRVFVTNFGNQKARDSATDNVIDCYPIKIPKDAVSVTVTVSGSNQQIACRVWYLLENGRFTDRNFNGSEIYPYKSVNYATGSNTLDISAITGRDDTFLFVWGQRVSGASYSGNEPTAITVTFSNS